MLNPTVNYWIDTSKDMDLNDFKEVGSIDGGNTAYTMQYINKKTQEKYCVKIFKPDFIRQNGNTLLNHEISLLSQIDNPAVLSLYGYNMNSQIVHKPIIITKYYPKNLSSYLQNQNISLSKKYIIILGIAQGMKYLHLVNITHRDLKPQNILLDENDHPVIGDLGISRFGSQGMGTSIGTYAYMAPEITSGNYSNKVDVYSFAITLFEIITQQSAYTVLTDSRDFFQQIINGTRPEISKIENTTIKDLIIKCWDADPTERPSFADIVERIQQPDFKAAMNADESEVSNYLATFDILSDPVLVRQKADSGNIVQAVKYADMLRTGENVPVDESEALHYYRIAAAQNNTYAMQQCARLLMKQNRKNDASNYLKSAIRLGDGDSLKYFIEEKLDELNRDEIADLYKSCADNGSPSAMYKYALLLYYGENVPMNKQEAYDYFSKAAGRGNVPANGYAGRMLNERDGVEANPMQEGAYFTEGIRREDPDSMLFYAISKLNDEYSIINKNDIIQKLSLSANSGNQTAMLFYATILLHGYLTVPANERLANDLIRRAEAINSREAARLTFNYAFRIFEGRINHFTSSDSELFFKISIPIIINLLPKDEALKHLKKASETGNELAKQKYCNMYGLFHRMFYNLESKRQTYNVDVNRHATSIIVTSLRDENKARLINALKEKNVINKEGTINEIKDAFKFVYVKNQTDEQRYQRLENEIIPRIVNGKLNDADFA